MGTPIFHTLDVNGDGSGSKNGAVDGSVTPAVFKYNVPAGKSFLLDRMLVYIQDSGTFDVEDYGNGVVLPSGIEIGVYNKSDDSLALDFLAGEPVKSNGDWAANCFDLNYFTFGTGDESISVRWTFTKTGGYIYVSDDQYFAVTINDNLSGLTKHQFRIQGRLKDGDLTNPGMKID